MLQSRRWCLPVLTSSSSNVAAGLLQIMHALAVICVLCSSLLCSSFAIIKANPLLGMELNSRRPRVRLGSSGTRVSCLAGSGAGNEDILSFGSRLDIKVQLPTNDRVLVERFLEDTGYVAENTWEKSKIRKVADNTYILQFLSIPIPGLAIVMPEVEVVFDNICGVIHMQSSRWSLKNADGGVLKDSTFGSSFDVQLSGQLRISPDGDEDAEPDYDDDDLSYLAKRRPVGGRKIEAEGYVVYAVRGRKPGVFRRAPAAVLDATVAFVQRCLSDFVNKRFGRKLTKAFREYSRQALVRDQEDWG